MTAFAYYLLKVILCSGVLFLYYQLALRNRAFHQWNRFYLLMAVALSAVVPLFQLTIFQESVEQNNALELLRSLQNADHRMQEFIIVSNRSISWEQGFFFAYGAICLCFLLAFLFSLAKLALITRKHRFCTVGRARLILADVAGTPFSFFNYVFWNKDLSLQSVSGQQIFQHELVHVTEKHTLDKLFLQITLVLLWCNPFFWLIRKEIHQIHEFIADEKAVGENNADVLAALVLQTAYPQQFASFTNAFFQTSIKRRLMMLRKTNRLTYAGRIMALPVFAFLLFAFTVRTKMTQADKGSGIISVAPATDTLPQKEIQSIAVNKNADTSLIITFKDGTRKAYTKEQAEKEGVLKNAKQNSSNVTYGKTISPKPLTIVDGKEYNEDLKGIDPNTIESINVLKGKSATEKYGKKGENGVIEISLKKGVNSVTQQEVQPIFEQAETPASIDAQEWRTFLSKHLQPIIENAARKGAKPGTYTVNIRFLVKTDGSLSNFTALNNPGYDFDKQLLAVMPNSPKWSPAEQNGKRVTSYHTQPITFVIGEQ